MIQFLRTSFCVALCAVLFLAGCGEEYFSTPEKTVQHYVKNRAVGSMQEMEACLGSFTKADKEWFEKHAATLCGKLYGMDCPDGKVAQQTTVWTDKFETAGPRAGEISSSQIDEKAGTATLVVDGKELQLVKERGNWKIKGLFGMEAELAEAYNLR